MSNEDFNRRKRRQRTCIAFGVAKNSKVEKIYCAPGNAGIASVAECVPIGAMEFDRLADFAEEKKIDLTVVGMDDPLVGALSTYLRQGGFGYSGPRKKRGDH